MKHLGIEERRVEADAGLELRQVVLGMLIFVLVGGGLNADWLYRDASLMEYGPSRTFWVRIATPVKNASDLLRLNVFRNWIERVSLQKEE